MLINKIADYLSSLPEGEIKPGIYASIAEDGHSISILSTWNGSNISLCSPEDFLSIVDPYGDIKTLN